MTQNPNLTDQFLAGIQTTQTMQLLQKRIVDLCHTKIPFNLRKLQITALLYFIRKNADIFFVVPTGYGKTIVAILSALYLWHTQKKKTIMIGLYKSLTSEQFETFSKYIPTMIDDGDHKDQRGSWESQEWVIGCFTPERFDVILSDAQKRDSLMSEVGLIVSDEIQNLADEGRGHRMENYIMICRFLYELRYIYLSATIGNPESLSEKLGCQLIQGTPADRPVPLATQFLPFRELTYSWSDEIPDFQANFALRIQMLKDIMRLDPNSTYLIFCTSKPRTKQIAQILCQAHDAVDLMDMAEEYHIAYHNADLSKEERKYIEDGYRSGSIKTIVCTPTLAAGVNLPADHVVIFDVEEFNMLTGKELIGANRIQQSIGRAGRPGLSKQGYAHIIYPDQYDLEINHRVLNPTVIKSQIKPRIHEKMLQWIAGEIGNDREVIEQIAGKSIDPIPADVIESGLNYLETFQFIFKDPDGCFSPLQLGLATNSQYLMPETIVYWIGQIFNMGSVFTMKELYLRFGSTPQYMDIIRVTKDDSKVIEYSEKELGKKFPNMTSIDQHQCLYCQKNRQCTSIEFDKMHCDVRIQNIHTLIPPQLLKAYFLTFYDDLKETYLPKKGNKQGDLEIKELPLSLGDRARLKEIGGRIFQSASYIVSKMPAEWFHSIDLAKLSSDLDILAKLCEAGTLNESLVELMQLRQIGYARAKLLVDAGIQTKDAFMTGNAVELGKILHLAPRIVSQIQESNTYV